MDSRKPNTPTTRSFTDQRRQSEKREDKIKKISIELHGVFTNPQEIVIFHGRLVSKNIKRFMFLFITTNNNQLTNAV